MPSNGCVTYGWAVANPPPSRVDKTICFQDAQHPNETKAEFKARVLQQASDDWDAHPPV